MYKSRVYKNRGDERVKSWDIEISNTTVGKDRASSSSSPFRLWKIVTEEANRTVEVIIFTSPIKVRLLAIYSYKFFCWRNTTSRNDHGTITPTCEENEAILKSSVRVASAVLLPYLFFFFSCTRSFLSSTFSLIYFVMRLVWHSRYFNLPFERNKKLFYKTYLLHTCVYAFFTPWQNLKKLKYFYIPI